MIDLLVKSNCPDVEHFRQNLNFHIVPVVNPDGYVYTNVKNRYWRMTRSKTSIAGCYGVDGNRNYGYHWGGKFGNKSVFISFVILNSSL